MNTTRRKFSNLLFVGSVLSVGIAPTAMASKLKASCYLLDKKNQVIQGINFDKRYEIASVSKIMTSLWAVSTWGPEYRYETKAHFVAVGPDIYDVHIEGSADPFYNREQFQFLVSELNSAGIRKIRTLSFDENFKFLNSTRDSAVVVGHYGTSFPSMNVVETHLKSAVANVGKGYAAVVRRAKQISDLEISNNLQLTVKEIKQMKTLDFRHHRIFATNAVKEVVQKSVPLVDLLKEMNRSSNNYAANVIFESLGGATLYKDFVFQKMGLKEAQIRFLNGSGDRFDLEDGTAAYNEATCQAIVANIGTLKAELESYRDSEGRPYSLADVMALAGTDAAGESSTVSSIYGNEVTNRALIAKTGTVSPAITLAGMASTEQGAVYFGYIYGTEGTLADWRDARNNIRSDVVALFKKYKNKKEIDYEASRFITFDTEVTIQPEFRSPKIDFETDQVLRQMRSKQLAKDRDLIGTVRP